jgi:hypothetical protein
MKAGVIRIQTGEQEFNWERSAYGTVSEMLPSNAPRPLGKYVMLIHYYDANLFHDIITGCSVTRILHLINKTPLDWYSFKKQATVVTATYGYKFVVAHTCVDQIVDLRTTSCYLDIPLQDKKSSENKMVVDSSTMPHAKLHNCHHVCHSIMPKEQLLPTSLQMHHLDGIFNPADILSNHWVYLESLLFFQGDMTQLYDEG